MGVCQSIVECQSLVEAKEISKKIDKQLYAESKQYHSRKKQKLLFLGPAECGKSTCVKQMQILHMNGFTDSEVEERRCIVYSNTVRSMLELAEAVIDIGLEFDDSSLINYVNTIRSYVCNGHEFGPIPKPIKYAIQCLWRDSAIRRAFELRSNYHIQDSAAHFFENIERITEQSYRPTTEDILLTRMPTTGVHKIVFTLKSIEFSIFDVGGQRSERRKWIHIFDDVNAVIFIAAINEFDQMLREENRKNRLFEAMDLFHGIANSKYFVKSSTILFLNKKDLFKEKIRKIPLSIVFPTYTGGLSYSQGIAFLRQRFRELYWSKRTLYIHETFATDTKQMGIIFNTVFETIVQENMKDAAL